MQSDAAMYRTRFCGGSRNFHRFRDLFDEIFILDVDAETLNGRLENRLDNDTGKSKSEREFILRLHKTKDDIPSGDVTIGATRPLEQVVDEILTRAHVEF